MICTRAWMNLKYIMLCERSQTHTQNKRVIQLAENYRKSKTIVIESRSEVARGWGLGKMTMNGCEGCFGVMQMFYIVIVTVLM